MQPETLREIMERAPRLSHFQYFKDRYALLFLELALGEGVSLAELKRGVFRALFDKPIVRRAIALAEGGALRVEHLGEVAPRDARKYRLSFGEWGTTDLEDWTPSYHQTTRPGLNLVLQLNFTREHNRPYYALLQPTRHPFVCESHPVSKEGLTLSWARIDIEADAGEALIEEVQSDWVRNAIWTAENFKAVLEDPEQQTGSVHPFWLVSYVAAVLEPHAAIWAEATLAAAIVFLRKTLGIRRIFYNTFEGSLILKELEPSWCPPRSLYSTLPRKFCFRRTFERPRALSRSRHPELRKKLRSSQLEWFLLELP